MLASWPVRAAGDLKGFGALLAACAAGLCFSAAFFSGGTSEAPLVWIGTLAFALAAIAAASALLGVLPVPRLEPAGMVFVGGLCALAVWIGASTIWSASPDSSWLYTNRTLVYVAFALAGVLLARKPAAIATGAAALLGLILAWALLAKCVPSLYDDYGRFARLRAPVTYWNALALLADVAVPLALWRRRATGTVLLYGAFTVVLLTYSRFGVVLAAVVAIAWVVLDRDRIESLAAIALAAAVAGGVFAIALALPGITSDGQPRSVRAHDGWTFALAVLAGSALVALGSLALARYPLAAERRLRIERIVRFTGLGLALAVVVLLAVFGHRLWNQFTNPVSSQVGEGASRFQTLNSSNRWRWWQEAWHAFTQHPFGGTGAATFRITDLLARQSTLTANEPHNVPLQFLSELGIVGLLLYVTTAAGAAAAILRARARAVASERAAVTALGLGVGAFLLHSVADFDWDFVALCGPMLFVAGVLVAQPGAERLQRRRYLPAVAAIAFALVAAYSLTVPWLAQRRLAAADAASVENLSAAIADARQAHALDPLSVTVLTDQADFEDLAGNALAARELYRKALALEPQNASVWYAYGVFWWNHKQARAALNALNEAYVYDNYGIVGTKCGYLDLAKRAVLGTPLPTCPGR